MNETFDKICQEVYNNREIDISRNKECRDTYKKIAEKYLNKYKKRKNEDIEACKRDIKDYSVKYFCKRLHGKPAGKVGDIEHYDKREVPSNESTLPIPTKVDIIDQQMQQAIIKRKDEIYRNLFKNDIRKITGSITGIGAGGDASTTNIFKVASGRFILQFLIVAREKMAWK